MGTHHVLSGTVALALAQTRCPQASKCRPSDKRVKFIYSVNFGMLFIRTFQSPRTIMGAQQRPVAAVNIRNRMCMSHHSRPDAVIETSKAGKHRVRPDESTKSARTQTATKTATVPVVRGNGTGEGWPPHIRKSPGLNRHDYWPSSPATSTSTLSSKEAGGNTGKTVVQTPNANGNR